MATPFLCGVAGEPAVIKHTVRDSTVEKRPRDVKKKLPVQSGSSSMGASLVPTCLDNPRQAY
jgi:hypothetical protein